MRTPCMPHYQAVQHVLRYLQGHPSFGVLLAKDTDFSLKAYCNLDWASCSHTRMSVSGYVSFGKSLLSWKSKKQGTIALSSAEAEYRSIRHVAELAWLTRLLHELTVHCITPVLVKCDNQAAICIAKNRAFHERTKQIEIDCHFVREKLLDGLISVSYTPTRLYLAVCSPSPSLVPFIIISWENWGFKHAPIERGCWTS